MGEVINSAIRSKRTFSKISLTDDDNTNIASQLTSNIPPAQHDAASYLHDRIIQDFTMTPICPNEVISVIDDLKDNGNKVNTIATCVLVESKHIIAPVICHLINLFARKVKSWLHNAIIKKCG